MKNATKLYYDNLVHLLLRDGSPHLENLICSFGLLFFSLVAKYILESYGICRVRFYEGNYVRLDPLQGRPLEAYKKGGICYFQFVAEETEAGYCVQYSGRTWFLPETGENIPLDPGGTLYFKSLEEAKAFYDTLGISAVLMQLGSPLQKLYSKKIPDARVC